MNRLVLHAALVIGAVALIACENKPETDTTTTTPPEPAAVVAPAAVSDEQIPTTADFETAAAQEITEANAEAELAKLEKEVSE